jgi:hypothetical protein
MRAAATAAQAASWCISEAETSASALTGRGALVLDVALRQCALIRERLRASEPLPCAFEFAPPVLHRGLSRLAFEFPHRDLGLRAGHRSRAPPGVVRRPHPVRLVSIDLHQRQALSGDNEIAFRTKMCWTLPGCLVATSTSLASIRPLP